MDLSVVVPTLNGRDQLGRCLDSLARQVPGAEVVVVNGPSADGTTGMVRERDDIDALVEVADRNRNVARNAGIAASTGEVVALVGYDLALEGGWSEAVRERIAGGADAVTGPTRRSMRVGTTTESEEVDTVAGRSITYFNGDNVAFTRETVEAMDGFDEYLDADGGRDGSHRITGLDRTVEWSEEMAVRREYGADGGTPEDAESYRSQAYRLTKSYGLRPAVARHVLGRAAGGLVDSTRALLSGETTPSAWVGGARTATGGLLVGTKDGLAARWGDRSPRRNPNGISSRYDRTVDAYDWR